MAIAIQPGVPLEHPVPRVSLKQARLNRVTIVDNAARLFLKRGFRGIALSEVMATSGLTLGGFYGHFESREALANEACTHAFEMANSFWQQRITAHRCKRLAHRSIVREYLRSGRTDIGENTCPLVAFSAEVAQEPGDSPIHQTYARGLESLIQTHMQTVETPNDSPDHAALRATALLQYALMVGAVTLARAARSSPLSEEILQVARDFLQVGDAPEPDMTSATSDHKQTGERQQHGPV